MPPLEFRFTRSIAAKIFGLALVLSFLTLLLTVYLLSEVARSERLLAVIAHNHLPLGGSVTKLHEIGLRRRLAFERINAEVGSVVPNEEIIAAGEANYERYSQALTAELANAKALLAAYPPDAGSPAAIAQVRLLLDQIETAYPAITARQGQLLALQRAHKFHEANLLNSGLGDLQDELQKKREALSATMTELSEAAARESAAHGRQILLLTAVATAFTILLGLLVAALISQRIVRPVRALARAMAHAQSGNLDVNVPVASSDEVGALTGSFNFFVVELKAKERIKSMFGKYIDPRILERVLSRDDGRVEAGERRNMSVLFADLVGFTGLSERLTPALMVTLLNRHFGLQAQAVQENKGVVDKFLGDAVMSFWGPPFTDSDNHALLACRSALAQVEMLKAFRRELPELTGLRKDVPTVDLRVGIFSGEVVVGNIGSENTRSYTVIGDTVNLASRFEGANRFYGTSILVGEQTARSVERDFETREVDLIAVKGHSEATALHELLGAKGATSKNLLRLRDAYGTALNAYRARRWEEAEMGFADCLRIQAGDGPATRMLARVRELRLHPPGEEWNGAWVAEGK